MTTLTLRDLGFVAAGQTATAWTPAQITTALWLDANDAATITTIGGAVSQWADKSGNAKHATQSATVNRPTYNVTGFNSLPCVTFANNNQDMALPTLVLTNAATLFYVFSVNSDAAYGVIASSTHWERFSDGTSYPETFRLNRLGPLNLSMPSTGQLIMCYAANPASSYTIRKNGAQIYTSGAFTFSNNIVGIGTGHAMGTTNDPHLNGSIVEVVVTPNALATTDLEKMEGYLAWKWALQSNLPAGHPYKSIAP